MHKYLRLSFHKIWNTRLFFYVFAFHNLVCFYVYNQTVCSIVLNLYKDMLMKGASLLLLGLMDATNSCDSSIPVRRWSVYSRHRASSDSSSGSDEKQRCYAMQEPFPLTAHAYLSYSVLNLNTCFYRSRNNHMTIQVFALLPPTFLIRVGKKNPLCCLISESRRGLRMFSTFLIWRGRICGCFSNMVWVFALSPLKWCLQNSSQLHRLHLIFEYQVKRGGFDTTSLVVVGFNLSHAWSIFKVCGLHLKRKTHAWKNNYIQFWINVLIIFSINYWKWNVNGSSFAKCFVLSGKSKT